jgi:hypothetical protein
MALDPMDADCGATFTVYKVLCIATHVEQQEHFSKKKQLIMIVYVPGNIRNKENQILGYAIS